MPGFRWELHQDIALCIETCKIRPRRPIEWLKIAEILNDLFSSDSKPVLLKGRGCKERIQLLLKKYDEEDKRALKRCVCPCSSLFIHVSVCKCSVMCMWPFRSGTEEEYTELAELLEDIRSYQRDFEEKAAEEKKSADEKKRQERRKGEEMRRLAMEGMSSM